MSHWRRSHARDIGMILINCPLIPSRNDPLEQALKINAAIVELFNAGRYSDAVPLAQRELAIYEKALQPNHPDVLTSLNTLAFFYEKQGRYADAEPLYQRAAAIRENEFGLDDPVVGSLLNTLAAIYNNQKRYAEAEPLQGHFSRCRRG
jgi:tetratricopeptide (TPR) repeat protein